MFEKITKATNSWFSRFLSSCPCLRHIRVPSGNSAMRRWPRLPKSRPLMRRHPMAYLVVHLQCVVWSLLCPDHWWQSCSYPIVAGITGTGENLAWCREQAAGASRGIGAESVGLRRIYQERERHTKSRKITRTLARCPLVLGHPARQTEVYRPSAGVPRTSRCSLFGIIERGVPQAYVRARAPSEPLRSVHVSRVFLCIFYIKMKNWYVSKRAWIHAWYVSKPVPPCDSTPLMIILDYTQKGRKRAFLPGHLGHPAVRGVQKIDVILLMCLFCSLI